MSPQEWSYMSSLTCQPCWKLPQPAGPLSLEVVLPRQTEQRKGVKVPPLGALMGQLQRALPVLERSQGWLRHQDHITALLLLLNPPFVPSLPQVWI